MDCEQLGPTTRQLARTAVLGILSNASMVMIQTPELKHEGDEVVVRARLSEITPSGTLRYRLPATYSYADQYPWGSHPLFDPLWSTEYLKVVHDGAEATRVEKTQRISDNPSAQQHLRICFQKKGDYNCGQCSKCIRTKIALELSGVLNKFEMLDNTIDLERLDALGIKSQSDLVFATENLNFAREQAELI
ncbi:hypothetical protein BANT918_02833 [Brevibacterium antiquum CNRZ 918]|uniref:Uncharacterized protein n=2 Tax=Brevibacteriaceae TaxID=85019 RepID=A0A2H1KUT3_9MICO|nr:hypothetical protein BANT918_02833 [Brevibacterium antiquum CNRZ 918]